MELPWVGFGGILLGKMGWKQGDHSERCVQVSCDSHLTQEEVVTRIGLWFHFDSRFPSIMVSPPQPLSLSGYASLWQPGKLRMSLGQGCLPKKESSHPSILFTKGSRWHPLRASGMKTPQELTKALNSCLHSRRMFSLISDFSLLTSPPTK